MRRETQGFVAVVLMIMAVFGAPAAPPTCQMSTPPLPPPDTPQLATRLQEYKNYGKVLDAFLRKAFSTGVQRQISKALADQANDIKSTLIWSGEKGELVDIVLTEPISGDQPGSLLYVAPVGAGACMMDVLIQDIDSPRSPHSLPPEHFRLSDSESFFAWATLNGAKQVQYTVENPGSRGPLIKAALEASATKDALKQAYEARRLQRVVNLATQAKAVADSAQLKAAIDRSVKAMQDSAKKAAKVQQDLADSLERQSAANGAVAWLDIMAKAVSVAQLGVQLNGLLRSTAPADVGTKIDNAAKANDLGQVRGVLLEWQNSTTQSVQKLTDEYSLLTTTSTKEEMFIINTAEKEGAPKNALPSRR